MLAPDKQYMVHSSEVVDAEGYAHRGSRIALVESSHEVPLEWRLRDFAFAAYSGSHAVGLRRVQLGKWTIWAFSDAREHCEEVVVFRKGADGRKKWNEDQLGEHNEVSKDMFFIMLARHITNDTPLGKQFNGEWGFWESFFVPLLDEQQSMQALMLMDPAMVEDFFSRRRLPVVCRKPDSRDVLRIPEGTIVTYEVKMACKEMEQWTDLCSKIGDDMTMQEYCVIEHKHLKPGDECIEAYHETSGIEEHARLIKRDFEQLKLPVIATFRCTMHVADQWEQDMISLQHKYDALNIVYHSNLLGGFSSMSGAKADPWSPHARLAVNALSKILARYPDIRTILDVGCGDMAWMKYFLEDNPLITYIGADIMPYCLALNFKRFPKLQFVQTDLSNLTGVEVLPRGCDLVLAKDLFNHMTLPDAVNALKRVINTRPRFLLTHVHGASDNTGWERRIDKHLHYTRYDYNKPPFSLPFPATDVQRISDEAYFVLYEISLEGATPSPPRTDKLRLPLPGADLAAFSLIEEGAWTEPSGPAAVAAEVVAAQPAPGAAPGAAPSGAAAGAAGGVGERTKLTAPVTELPDRLDEVKAGPERRTIKGLPAMEFRARCDLVFDRYDADRDGALRFAELAALMEAGGRRVETQEAYASMCSKLGCDASAGLGRKDLHLFFEKAPPALWEEVYRSIDPLAGMVRKGAAQLPEAFLERPLSTFLFEDEAQFANVYVELNAHMYYGAAELVSLDTVQAYFGPQRLELHICAPGSFGAKDMYKWKFVVAPLAGEVVPEDCIVELKQTDGRFGSQRLDIKLMKAKKRKWYKVGQVSTGPKT